MPIYEYRCERGHTFEVMQRMTDDPVTTCSTCDAPVARVFHPVAVHFKGSGFYTTDYGKKKPGSSDSTAGKTETKESGSKDSGSTDSGAKGSGSTDTGSSAGSDSGAKGSGSTDTGSSAGSDSG